MQFTIDQKTLTQALGKVAPAVPVAHAAYSGVKTTVDAGYVSFIGTDLEFTIETTVPVENSVDGVAVIPFKMFNEITKTLSGEVTVTSEDNDVTINAGSFDATIRGYHVDDYPRIKEIEGAESTVDTDVLTNALDRVAGVASRDEARPILTGVLFRSVEGVLNLVSTDSYRLAVQECDGSLGDDSGDVLVPSKAATEIVKLFRDIPTITVTLGGNGVRFASDDTKVSSRLIDGDFPNYKNLIPESSPSELVVNRLDLIDAVKRVRLFARENVPVKLVITETNVNVEAIAVDVGDASENVDAKFTGEDLTIGFNPEYLLYGLNESKGDTVSFAINDQNKPAIISGETDSGWTYLLMPVRT